MFSDLKNYTEDINNRLDSLDKHDSRFMDEVLSIFNVIEALKSNLYKSVIEDVVDDGDCDKLDGMSNRMLKHFKDTTWSEKYLESVKERGRLVSLGCELTTAIIANDIKRVTELIDTVGDDIDCIEFNTDAILNGISKEMLELLIDANIIDSADVIMSLLKQDTKTEECKYSDRICPVCKEVIKADDKGVYKCSNCGTRFHTEVSKIDPRRFIVVDNVGCRHSALIGRFDEFLL